MEFNDYIRWYAEDLEALTEAQTACMKMFEESGKFEWVGTAAQLNRKAEAERFEACAVTGWYLV